MHYPIALKFGKPVHYRSVDRDHFR